jgi:predicted GNAT family acetyltransferase
MDFIVEQNRIYKQDGHGKLIAELLFPDSGDGIVAFTHTFVDESLRGQGIADQLMNTAVAELKAQGKRAKTFCSYAVKWFDNHPEYNDLLA